MAADDAEETMERTVALDPASKPKSAPLPFGERQPGSAEPAPLGNARSEACELVWFGDTVAARARRKREWRELLADLDRREPDPELDDPALGLDPAASEERRELFHVMVHGAASPLGDLGQAVRAAVRSDGKLVPPLVLVAGTLSPSFDPADSVRVAAAIAAPFAAGDAALQGAVTAARDLLTLADLPAGLPHYDAVLKRLREAFGQNKRPVPRKYFDEQLRRGLLEKRSYQLREVLGAPHVRAQLAAGDGPPVLVYLPAAAAKLLPLAPSFPVRALAIVHVRLDAFEPAPLALEVQALARTVALAELTEKQS